MAIGLSKARELSAKELDQVSGGGATYGGSVGSPGWTKPPVKPPLGH
ncbi:MAG: bacteriocin [Xanthobacteraceae bacterium]